MVAIVVALLSGATLFLKRYGPVLRQSLSKLILLVGGAGALLLTDQGAEIAEGLTDDGWWMPVLFVLSVSFWAWQSWFWSRAALNLRFGPNRQGLAPARMDHLAAASLRHHGLPRCGGPGGPGAGNSAGERAAWFYAIGAALILSAVLFLGAAIDTESRCGSGRMRG